LIVNIGILAPKKPLKRSAIEMRGSATDLYVSFINVLSVTLVTLWRRLSVEVSHIIVK